MRRSLDTRAVAGQAEGIAGYVPTLAPTTGSKDNCFALKQVNFTGTDLDCDHPGQLTAVHDQIHDVKFIEEIHVGFDALLVQRLQNHMAGPVSSMAGPPHRAASNVV